MSVMIENVIEWKVKVLSPLDAASSICLYYNRISKIPVTAA